MRVGILFDLYDDYPWVHGEAPDADAENEPPETIDVLTSAIRQTGHEPVPVGGARTLLRIIDEPGFDVGLNIAEGARSRNREGWVPTLLELAGIPFVGSDALTLSLSLDKALTKDLAATAGLRTPEYRVYRRADDVDERDLPAPFPLFVKPRYEGSAKGLGVTSRVENIKDLTDEIERLVMLYDQEVLVEAFICGGGEFTVGVVGYPPKTLPAIQRAVETQTGIGLHVLEGRSTTETDWQWELPGNLTKPLETRLRDSAVRIFRKLDCRDFARVDFRVDAEGTPWFLEINPLPTFRPDDTFAIAAELQGRDYSDFLAEILSSAIDRAVEREPQPETSAGRERPTEEPRE